MARMKSISTIEAEITRIKDELSNRLRNLLYQEFPKNMPLLF